MGGAYSWMDIKVINIMYYAVHVKEYTGISDLAAKFSTSVGT